MLTPNISSSKTGKTDRSGLLIKIEIRIFIIVLLLTDLIASFSLRIAPQFPLGWNLFAVKNFRTFKTNFQNPVCMIEKEHPCVYKVFLRNFNKPKSIFTNEMMIPT